MSVIKLSNLNSQIELLVNSTLQANYSLYSCQLRSCLNSYNRTQNLHYSLKCQAFGLGTNIKPREITENLDTPASRVSAMSVDARVCNDCATVIICYLPLYVIQIPPPEMGFPQRSPQPE